MRWPGTPARCSGVLEGRELEPVLAQAAELLATVTGQDLEQDAAGVFKIARRVAPDRVISTVDPEARHGHKTSARGFDGYKGHIAVDPDSEIITATDVTRRQQRGRRSRRGSARRYAARRRAGRGCSGTGRRAAAGRRHGPGRELTAGTGQAAVYGDAAYGSGELLERVEDAGIYTGIKVQPPPR